MDIMGRWRVVKTQGPIAKEHVKACFAEAVAIINDRTDGQVMRFFCNGGQRILSNG